MRTSKFNAQFLLLFLITFLSFNFKSWGQQGLSKSSVYQLKGEWTDQNGKSHQLTDFLGKPTIVAMGYTSCIHSCPLIISKVKEIEKSLEVKKIKNYQILFLSFDTVRD
ncbi:MAG: SCO family protein, partial [Bdellovibrionales bacterium]|nr:SCO family protein [Bdellovibrionales bacterium]